MLPEEIDLIRSHLMTLALPLFLPPPPPLSAANRCVARVVAILEDLTLPADALAQAIGTASKPSTVTNSFTPKVFGGCH